MKYLNLINSLAVIWSKYKEGYTDTLIRVDTTSLAPAQEKPLPDAEQTSKPSAILDMDALEEAKSLLRDKFDFFLGCYFDDVETYIREIQSAISSKNIEAVVRPAHTIKSTSKRMGAMRLAEIAKDIEFEAREAANGNQADQVSTKLLNGIRDMSSIFAETRQTLTAAVKK